MWGMFPRIAASVLRIFVSTLGRPKIATAITFLALFVNALGNWALVFGHLGLPALGLHGSALSSIITSSVMLLAYILVIQSDRRLRRYHLFVNWWRPEWPRFRVIVRIGPPVEIGGASCWEKGVQYEMLISDWSSEVCSSDLSPSSRSSSTRSVTGRWCSATSACRRSACTGRRCRASSPAA